MSQAEVIREFLVKLGFSMDSKSLKSFNENVEAATKGVEKFVVTMGGVSMAVGAGVAAFASKLETLYFATQKTGASAINLKSFEKTVVNFGGSAEGALQSVQSLARFMREKAGSEGFLQSLGIQTRDANGNLKETTDLMVQVGGVLSKMSYPLARQYGNLLGIDEDTFRAIMDGKFSAEMGKQHAILKESNFEQTIKDAHDFMVKLREVEARLEAIGVKIGSHIIEPTGRAGEFVIPILKTIADGWKNIYDWVKAAGAKINEVIPKSWGEKIGAGTAWLFDKLGIRGAVDKAMGIGDGSSMPAARPGTPATTPATTPGARPGTPQERLASIGEKYGLPSWLLDRVWAAESGRGKNMRSPAGAQGHFQFMPSTAKQYGLTNPDDFEQSADASARYISDLMTRYAGNLQKAVAAYNWGPGNVDKYGLGKAPAETRGYLDKVLGATGGSAGVTVAQNTTINVHGGDAAATGREVAGEQSQVNQTLVRNMQSAIK